MGIGRVVKLSVVLLMSLAFVPAIALAQGQTGTIAGAVKDTTGAVLPGVTVEVSSPALIEKTRTGVTDGSGQYRIVDLRPGTYSVSFTLTGFSTVKREGIELTSAFTATVNADLKVGSVEETITVSGASPIVDTQNVVQKQTASREVMDALPTDRNFVSFAAMTPGVFVTGVSQNVGGSVPETGMNLVVHGSRAGDSMIMVDGMPIINGSGNGGLQYGNYLNNALAQEITFQTGGNSAEFERASVISNFIPKEGSNVFRGSFETRYTNDSLESNNLDATQISQGLKSANLVKKIWDINPVAGGPIIKDRMWIFGGYRHWGTYNNVAGSFKDASFTEKIYSCAPDASGNCTTAQNLFPVWHQSAAARLTTQVTPKNKVNLYYDWQFTDFGNCFVPSLLTAISACPEYKNIPQYVVQGSWSSPVSSKLLLEAGGTLTAQDFHGFLQPGVPQTQFQVTERNPQPGQPSTWGSAGLNYGANRSNQINYRSSASYVTGSHSLKVGFTLMHQWRYVTQEPNNSLALTLQNGLPFQLTEYATPISFHETVNYNVGIFAQDQWTFKRLTANYGVRLDMLQASVDPQSLAAGPYTPARTFPGTSNVPNWKDIDPRFGVAYDLFGNGKTAIKASIGRYVIADSYTIARAVNPEQTTANSTLRSWTSDPAGQLDPRLDCDLTNPNANGSCGPYLTPSFGTSTVTTTYDPGITSGWSVRPYNWETQVSVQQQVAPRVSVYAGYSHRTFGNMWATLNTAVSNASFTSYCINVPTAPGITGVQLPNAGGQECGFTDLVKPTTALNVVQSASNLGSVSDKYDGFDFDANARLGKGTFISGGVSLGREAYNICALEGNYGVTAISGSGATVGSIGSTVSRTDTAFCNVSPPFQPNVKGQLSYPFPWGIGGSVTFQSLPGAQVVANDPLTNTSAGLTLGRAFTTPPSVSLVAPGTSYLGRIYQTDVRFTKTIKYRATTIRPTFSVYNLFNANPTNTNAAYQTTYGAAWLQPTVILTPRFADIGVQIQF